MCFLYFSKINIIKNVYKYTVKISISFVFILWRWDQLFICIPSTTPYLLSYLRLLHISQQTPSLLLYPFFLTPFPDFPLLLFHSKLLDYLIIISFLIFKPPQSIFTDFSGYVRVTLKLSFLYSFKLAFYHICIVLY